MTLYENNLCYVTEVKYYDEIIRDNDTLILIIAMAKTELAIYNEMKNLLITLSKSNKDCVFVYIDTNSYDEILYWSLT